MEIKTFSIEGVKHLVIELAARDSRVRGQSAASIVSVSYVPGGAGPDPEFAVQGDTLTFRGGSAVLVSVPAALAVTIYEAAGDLRVQNLLGPVVIDAVHGDLRLRDLNGAVQAGRVEGSLRADRVMGLRVTGGCAGDVRVEEADSFSAETIDGDTRLFELRMVEIGLLHGDLWAERVTGEVAVAHAEGDVRLADIGGSVTIGSATGDLRAAALGGLASQGIHGDADLRGPFDADHDYDLAAGGDLTVYLPIGADLRLVAQAAGRIRSDIQLTPAPDGSAHFTATLGRGTARIAVGAGGDLRVLQADTPEPGVPDWADLSGLGALVRQQVGAALAATGSAPAAGQPGLEHAETAVGRSRSGKRKPQPAEPARPLGTERVRAQAAQPTSGASEAEELAILKMVESGTITAAEAEALLQALGA